MATVNVLYSCGCGAKAHSVEAAVRHSDGFGHTMSVSGAIISTTPKVVRPKVGRPIADAGYVRQPAQPTRSQLVVAADTMPAPTGNLDSLRARLGK